MRSRLWLLVATALALWFVHPLWSARVLPLHDLPNHLARITALHYLSDPRWNLASFYARSLGLVPYLGHFYLVHLLAYVTRSVVTANLVFMSAYILATPLCGYAFARATGRSPWLALLLLPLSVATYFQWGFLSFCAGVMLMLPALAALYRLLDAPAPRAAVTVGLWCAALYLFHIVPWGAFGLYALLLLVVEAAGRRWRTVLLTSAAMAPSLLFMLLGMHRARAIGYLGDSKYLAFSDTPSKLLSRAVGMLNWFQAEASDEWLLVGLMLIVVLLLASDAGEPDEPWRRRIRVPLALVVCVGLAFATPFWIKRPFNWWMVNQRFLLPAACFAVFLPRGPIQGARALLIAAAVLLMLPLPNQMRRQYRLFSARVWPLIDLIRSTPQGSTTLMLHEPGRSFEDPMLAPQMTIWRELYNYPLVYRGGYDPYLYDDGFPIRRVRALPAPKVPRAAEQFFSPEEARFDPSTMMQGWDYFIVPEEYRSIMPPDGALAERDAGSWTLYKNLNRP